MTLGPSQYSQLQAVLGAGARYLIYAGPMGLLTRVERVVAPDPSDAAALEALRSQCLDALYAACAAADAIVASAAFDIETQRHALGLVEQSIAGERLAALLPEDHRNAVAYIDAVRSQLIVNRLSGSEAVADRASILFGLDAELPNDLQAQVRNIIESVQSASPTPAAPKAMADPTAAPSAARPPTSTPAADSKLPTPKALFGIWDVGGYETVLAADMTYAARKEEGHEGSYGSWSITGGDDGETFLMLTITTIFPTYVYGTQYVGSIGMGATKIEFPKKMALKILRFDADSFAVHHDYGPEPLVYTRREKRAESLLAVRVEQLKSLLTTQEASYANNIATYNIQFGIATGIQTELGKQINKWRPS